MNFPTFLYCKNIIHLTGVRKIKLYYKLYEIAHLFIAQKSRNHKGSPKYPLCFFVYLVSLWQIKL